MRTAAPLPASLVYLDVSNNSLTGPVPDFSDAAQLTLLDVSSNQLTGDIPASFGAAGDSVVYVDFSRNLLGGDINDGSQWEELPRVQYLFMSENNLQGEGCCCEQSCPALLGHTLGWTTN